MRSLKSLRLLHKALGELIERGFVRVDKDHAGVFEEMIVPLACCEISSDGCRFTLIEDDNDDIVGRLPFYYD